MGVPDKSPGNIIHLLLQEMSTSLGCPLEIVTDRGLENINNKTLGCLHIHHIKSYYLPSNNGKCEQQHRVLHDVLSKKIYIEAWEEKCWGRLTYLEQQNRSSILVYKHMKAAKQKQNRQVSNEIELLVGDPVYVKKT